MDSNTSADSTPDLSTPDPDPVWQAILASLEAHEPGISSWDTETPEGRRNFADAIRAAMKARSRPGQPDPEPEAGQ